MRLTHAALERFDELGEHGDLPDEDLERLRDRYEARLDRLRDRLEEAGGHPDHRTEAAEAQIEALEAERELLTEMRREREFPRRAAARAGGRDRRRRGARALARPLMRRTLAASCWPPRWPVAGQPARGRRRQRRRHGLRRRTRRTRSPVGVDGDAPHAAPYGCVDEDRARARRREDGAGEVVPGAHGHRVAPREGRRPRRAPPPRAAARAARERAGGPADFRPSTGAYGRRLAQSRASRRERGSL